MDTETLKAMADRLQELADGAEPMDSSEGVCKEVGDMFGFYAHQFVVLRMKSWPEHSGNDSFPVSAPCVPSPYDAYQETDNLWTGEYGAARRRLCGFLAQEIRKEIGDEN